MAIRRSLPEACIWDFFNEFLVHCPKCSNKAIVKDRGKQTSPRFVLACATCAYSDTRADALRSHVYRYTMPTDEDREDVVIGAPADPYFHQKLWLQSPCCGEILWFYNRPHLQWVEDYVRATLRERKPHPNYKNKTLSSRLPGWIKKAKNREPIIRAIQKMKARQ